MVRYVFLLLALSSSFGRSSDIDDRALFNRDDRELDEVIDFSSDDLRDVCEGLEDDIPSDSVAAADICSCAQNADVATTIDLTCNIDNACLSSNGMPAMQGDFSLGVTREGIDVESFTQTVGIKSCFTYPDGMYDGQKVCYSTIADGLGTNSQCRISVGESEEDTCLYCRFCVGRKLTFNCTNLGYEDKSDCVENNLNGSLLQFLYEPEIVDTCPKDSDDDSGSSSQSGGSFVRGIAYTIVAVASMYMTWAV